MSTLAVTPARPPRCRRRPRAEKPCELCGTMFIPERADGRYHSVDTGKYTLVPWWGVRVADRVEGIDR